MTIQKFPTVALIINGESKNSISGETYEVRNPATSEMLERVPKGTREDAKAAIDAASDAFNKWSNTRPIERAKLLLKATEVIESQKAEIARLITLENGKPLQDAIGEMDWVLSTMRSEIYANVRLFGDFFRRTDPDNLPLDASSPLAFAAFFCRSTIPAYSGRVRYP